jgi:hypothetical protein
MGNNYKVKDRKVKINKSKQLSPCCKVTQIHLGKQGWWSDLPIEPSHYKHCSAFLNNRLQFLPVAVNTQFHCNLVQESQCYSPIKGNRLIILNINFFYFSTEKKKKSLPKAGAAVVPLN